MINPDWDKDEGRRVVYRHSPAAATTLGGVLVRKARGREPAAMVLFDGSEEPRIAYLGTLEWER